MFNKIILTLSLIVFSFTSQASTVDQASLKRDVVNIFNVAAGGYLKNEIKMYDNPRFEGDPIFILQSKSVRKKNKEVIEYQNLHSCLKKMTCYNSEDLKGVVTYYKSGIDFLELNGNEVNLIINEIGLGHYVSKDGGKKYYFKISDLDFINDNWKGNSVFEISDNSINGKVLMDDLIKKDQSLSKFLTDLKKCQARKDIECLKKLSTDNLNATLLDELKIGGVVNDPALCKELKNYYISRDWDLEPPEHITVKAKNFDYFWNDLADIISLDPTKMTTGVSKTSFDKHEKITFYKKIDKKKKCDNEADLTIQIIKVDNDWKIDYVDTFRWSS